MTDVPGLAAAPDVRVTAMTGTSVVPTVMLPALFTGAIIQAPIPLAAR